MESLLVERADGVVTCTLNRPAKKNALTHEMWLGLAELFDEVAENRADRVLVITGAGDGFCSGADLGGRAATAEAGRGPAAERWPACASSAGPAFARSASNWRSRRSRL